MIIAIILLVHVAVLTIVVEVMRKKVDKLEDGLDQTIAILQDHLLGINKKR